MIKIHNGLNSNRSLSDCIISTSHPSIHRRRFTTVPTRISSSLTHHGNKQVSAPCLTTVRRCVAANCCAALRCAVCVVLCCAVCICAAVAAFVSGCGTISLLWTAYDLFETWLSKGARLSYCSEGWGNNICVEAFRKWKEKNLKTCASLFPLPLSFRLYNPVTPCALFGMSLNNLVQPT